MYEGKNHVFHLNFVNSCLIAHFDKGGKQLTGEFTKISLPYIVCDLYEIVGLSGWSDFKVMLASF